MLTYGIDNFGDCYFVCDMNMVDENLVLVYFFDKESCQCNQYFWSNGSIFLYSV